MAFSIDTTDMSVLHDYAAALDRWSRTKPWRNGTDGNERPLGLRTAKHKTIRKLTDGSIACKLYSTDVVTYHPDDTITLHPYGSVSTDKFANAILPAGIRTSFNNAQSHITLRVFENNGWSNRLYRIYRAANTFTVIRRGDSRMSWVPIAGQEIKPFEVPRMDIKAANAALKLHGFADFQAWAKSYLAIANEPGDWSKRHDQMWNLRHLRDGRAHAQTVIDHLKAGVSDGWMHIINTYGLNAVEAVRTAIYQAEDVVTVVERPFLNSQTELQSIRSAGNRYPWL